MKINWDYHIHTNFADGENSVDEIAKYSAKLNLTEIAITDHVRKNLSYDFSELIAEIKNAEKKYNIKIRKGAEARILPNGELDISEEVLNKTEMVIGSIHSWPKDVSFENGYRLLSKTKCRIIGHVKFLNETLIKLFVKNDKVLEINNQYRLIAEELQLIKKFPKLKISFGSNAHKTSDIKPAQEYFQEIAEHYCNENQLWKI